MREPADSTNPGRIGGRSASSTIDGPGLPREGLPSVGLSGREVSTLCVSDLSTLGITCQSAGAGVELLRNLASVRGVMVVSAMGDAVTIVPAKAMGGGRGLFGLNNG